MVIQIIDKIVAPDDRKSKYTDSQMVKILIALQIFNISYRASNIFPTNHEEYIRMVGLREYQVFRHFQGGQTRSLNKYLYSPIEKTKKWINFEFLKSLFNGFKQYGKRVCTGC